MKPTIAITIGDFNGIGPEIVLKSAIHPKVKSECRPLLVGPLHVFEHIAKEEKLKIRLEKSTPTLINRSVLPVFDVGDAISADIEIGAPTKSSGKNAGIAIERAVELCLQKKVDAMVTAPVSKEALNLGGYNFPGQTEMITLLSLSKQVVMMLLSPLLNIGLITIHTAIRDVASGISEEKILEKISIINLTLKRDLGIQNPRIAVLALNPHAGEQGLIGNEENDVITPALSAAKAAGINVEGPFAADGFFGTHRYKNYDVVVAQYHDQGLIPLKMLSFELGVNYSAGLPIIRTSPDHGTAYDIAGKHKANISSMIEAILTAVHIFENRNDYDRNS